jgi:hypothetical protein
LSSSESCSSTDISIIISSGDLRRRRRLEVRFHIGVGSIVNEGSYYWGSRLNVHFIVGNNVRLNCVELLRSQIGVSIGVNGLY